MVRMYGMLRGLDAQEQRMVRMYGMLRVHGCTGATNGQGCTVCCGCMDAQEQRMVRMYGMLRGLDAQEQRMVRDVRYVAGAGCTGATNGQAFLNKIGEQLFPTLSSIESPHCQHPWLSILREHGAHKHKYGVRKLL
jgi:hypothetical protein